MSAAGEGATRSSSSSKSAGGGVRQQPRQPAHTLALTRSVPILCRRSLQHHHNHLTTQPSPPPPRRTRRHNPLPQARLQPVRACEQPDPASTVTTRRRKQRTRPVILLQQHKLPLAHTPTTNRQINSSDPPLPRPSSPSPSPPPTLPLRPPFPARRLHHQRKRDMVTCSVFGAWNVT